jgi:hypothetical protein
MMLIEETPQLRSDRLGVSSHERLSVGGKKTLHFPFTIHHLPAAAPMHLDQMDVHP